MLRLKFQYDFVSRQILLIDTIDIYPSMLNWNQKVAVNPRFDILPQSFAKREINTGPGAKLESLRQEAR